MKLRSLAISLWVALAIALTYQVTLAQEGQDVSPIPAYSGDVEAAGDVLILYGQVLDVNANPLAGATVEIWQTDSNGAYDHPNAQAANIDSGFQHFGSSIADENGVYSFRTIVPSSEGIGRPLHIHVKVKIDSEELVTTQFYFEEDLSAAQKDQFFNAAGANADLMILQPETVEESDGNQVEIAYKDLIVATAPGMTGALMPTPAQTEGPFYPVVDLAGYDSDLAIVSAQPELMSGATEVEFTLLNLNTATGDEFQTISNVGNRMVREFNEYRPYISILQFRREIGKYVDESQVAAYEQYVYVPVDINQSDSETLKQLPGVDDTIAEALMAGRPYESNAAFLQQLGQYVTESDLTVAGNYLAAQS